MILISYVKPYIVIRSDEIISGHLSILGNDKKVLWTDKFRNKDFLSIKVRSEWKENIEVVVESDHEKSKKDLSI